MSEQFRVRHDETGDLWMRAGWVLAPRHGVSFRVGADETNPMDPEAQGLLPALENDAEIFLGGSGLNVVVSGIPGADVPNGIWRPLWRNKWGLGGWVLEWDSVSGGGTISDADAVVATLASGGPDGSYVATSYGEDEYGSSATFSVTAALEAAWPGTIPSLRVTPSAGVAQGGIYDPIDIASYESAEDSAWTLEVAEDGSAVIADATDDVATRPVDSPPNNPAGEYASTTYGQTFNPAEETDPEFPEEPAEVSPYGLLTVRYDWTASSSNDLDTGTTFLGETLGYNQDGASDYMTWGGDVTSASGYEEVVVDLAAAWADGFVGDFAEIFCAADWYPSAGGYGPATLIVSYEVDGVPASWSPLTIEILPPPASAGITPAATPVQTLRIDAAGEITQPTEPWVAQVGRIRVPPPEGTIYLELVEVAGVPASVNGPFFATSLPASTSDHFYVTLATSDGAGTVEQVVSGPVQWP